MYGTYSVSRRGAHEGIDFAAEPGTVELFSPVWGTALPNTAANHLAVYDPNHGDGPKVHSFLHLSSKTEVTDIGVGYSIGRQGNSGINSTGYHLHFEVHSGSSSALSYGDDDNVTSQSPYRLTRYIGEAG